MSTTLDEPSPNNNIEHPNNNTTTTTPNTEQPPTPTPPPQPPKPNEDNPNVYLPLIRTTFKDRLHLLTNPPTLESKSTRMKKLKKLQLSTEPTTPPPPITHEETSHYINIYNHEGTKSSISTLINSVTSPPTYLQTDFDKTRYANENAFGVFYSKYHKNQEYRRKGVTSLSTPSFNFINSLKQYLIIPNPVALVKRKGDASTISVNNHRLGDNYIKCLTSSLEIVDHITTINISNNRLTDTSIIPLLTSIESNSMLIKRLINFDISYNKIGSAGATAIKNYIINSDCSLEYLNMEGNNLGNDNMGMIVDSIVLNLFSKLRYLNIAQNNIGDQIATNVAALVKACEYLNVLILYQNKFKNYGAGLIMSEIKRHQRLKILDFSWNLIGTKLSEETPIVEELIKISKNPDNRFNNAYIDEMLTSMQYRRIGGLNSLPPVRHNKESFFTKELCELFLNKDTELLHLDISYNNINYIDAEKIAEHIKQNHTILGIHVDGNEMEVDELGFVYPIDKNNYKPNHFANSQVFYRISNDHPLSKSNVLNVQKIKHKNNCWICEGWKEVKFHYKPHNYEGNVSEAQVKLHLEFEGYKPYDMEYKQEMFMCYRMCPPGDLNLYCTLNDIPVENYGPRTHELKDAIVYVQPPKPDNDDNINEDEEEKEPKQFIITKVARAHVEINPEVISSRDYSKMIKVCVPRPEKKIIKKKRPRTPWTFPISIWAYYKYNYEGDNEDLINGAFEFDFNRGQYTKDKDLSEEQLPAFKDFLRTRYPKILDSYKYLSSYLGWRVFQIGQNQLTEFASTCPGLLDNKYLINDVLVKVTEVKSNFLDKEEKKRNNNIPDNIIRHQWMMLLVKIAKDKYFRTKQITSFPESVTYSFEKHFDSFINQFDHHKWRQQRYYNELVDNVLKAYAPIYDAVFKSWAPQKIIGRESNWMWLEEFTSICNALMDSDFPVKEIPTIYSLSMRVQTDEINRDNHINMRFPEFLEAFARFADRLSPVPIGENKLEWSMQQRSEQHLSTKLESLIPSMMKLIKHPDYRVVKDKFTLPVRDEESGLLVVDYGNQFYGKLIPMPRSKKRRTTRGPTTVGGA